TGLALPEGPYETVAGYIVQQLGHVPDVGETAGFDGHTLTVVGLDGRRIARVKVKASHAPSYGLTSFDGTSTDGQPADPSTD
ncbi:MAG: transporter associated domain-containing protein, partial [Nocardioidaceae bacterium]